MDAGYQTRGGSLVPERDNNTTPCLRLGYQVLRQGVGEQSLEGNRQDYVNVMGQFTKQNSQFSL